MEIIFHICVQVGRGTSCSSSPMPTASPGKEEEACSSRRVRGGGGWTCSLASMYSRGPPGRGEGEGSRSRQEREAALGKEVRGEGRWTGSLTAEPGRGSTWGREVERSCVSPDRPGTKLRVAGAAQGGVPQAAGHVCGWGGGQVRHHHFRQHCQGCQLHLETAKMFEQESEGGREVDMFTGLYMIVEGHQEGGRKRGADRDRRERQLWEVEGY